MTNTGEFPWHAEYEQFGIPHTLEPYPEKPVHELLATAARRYPGQGMVQRGQKYTYPTVLSHGDRLATALTERNVGKGDRVGTVLPTSVQFIVASYAISRIGGVHIPNDFLDAEQDLVYRLEQGAPDVLIGQDRHRELLFRLRDELDIKHVILTELTAYSPDPPEHHEEIAGVEWFSDLIEATDPDPPAIDIDAEDVHTLLFTGGTTGRAKGVLLTHRNIYANTLQAVAGQSKIAQLMRGQEAAILSLPMYHAYGYTMVNALVELGLDVLLVADPRNTELMVELVETHEPVVMLGVPTQFIELVDERLEQDVIGLSGSAPLADDTRKRFERSSKGISQGYGLSEMTAMTHFNTRGLLDMMTGTESVEEGFDQPTVGVPMPDTSVKLRDVDTGEPVPIDEAIADERRCELCLDGPQRMRGYLKADDPFDAEGYVSTGDIVKIDTRGRFYIVDRVKNMVNVSGLKVYTEEIDEVLYGHPGVKRPATIGIPDPERPGSERVKFYIEPEPDVQLTAAEIRDHVSGKIPRQALPQSIEIIDEMPLTEIGKVDKRALEKRHNGTA